MINMGDLIAGILATVFSILVVVRAPGALREAARVRMWLAHLVMALVLWLSVTVVYMSVDTLLGGRNITNLLSHFGFYLMFWLGGAGILQAKKACEKMGKLSPQQAETALLRL